MTNHVDTSYTLSHAVLHLAKETGLLAAAAERLEHSDKEGKRLLEEWMVSSFPEIEKTLRILKMLERS